MKRGRRRAVAIIQARLGSQRFPGKVLADVGGAPLLARMVERVRRATTIAAIVVATPEGPRDEPLRELARHLGVDRWAGSEDDVLARYAGAAERFGADPIVRLTADCPLIDPALVDRCVERFLAADCDIVGLGGAFPDGLDTEVISAAALARAHAEARLPSEREHVTPYLWKHRDRFRGETVEFPASLGGRRWTVDEPRDLDFVRAVYQRLYRSGGGFGWQDVEALLAREPDLARLNQGIERNAGYRASLARDGAA
jgi:spore coat polysaccharide biosynthesis protein SpsF